MITNKYELWYAPSLDGIIMYGPIDTIKFGGFSQRTECRESAMSELFFLSAVWTAGVMGEKATPSLEP